MTEPRSKLPTDDEIRAYQAKRNAELDAEFTANPPVGSSGFTRREWSALTFGDQAHYRRGKPNPDHRPNPSALRAMADAMADTPSPSIMSGYGVWACDILELLDRRGWKLVRK